MSQAAYIAALLTNTIVKLRGKKEEVVEMPKEVQVPKGGIIAVWMEVGRGGGTKDVKRGLVVERKWLDTKNRLFHPVEEDGIPLGQYEYSGDENGVRVYRNPQPVEVRK